MLIETIFQLPIPSEILVTRAQSKRLKRSTVHIFKHDRQGINEVLLMVGKEDV